MPQPRLHTMVQKAPTSTFSTGASFVMLFNRSSRMGIIGFLPAHRAPDGVEGLNRRVTVPLQAFLA